MSNYHLIPTYSFAPRLAHDMMDSFQPSQMMDLMERMFDTTGGAAGGLPMSLTPRRRGFGEIHIGEDPKKFELSFDLGGNCKPDDVDINVKLLDNDAIQIEARHETGSVESGEYRNHYFSKTISLPEGIDVQALKSTLTEHGVLKVEAPMLAIEEPKPAVREIQIQRMVKPE